MTILVRVKAGIKATITRNGEKRQIRLLNYDLKTLHAKFRDTCLNLQDMSEYISQIRKSLLIKEVDKFVETMKSSRERKDCMYGECNICRGNGIPFDQNVNQGKKVSWFNLKTKSVDREKTVDGETVFRKVNIASKEADYGSLEV